MTTFKHWARHLAPLFQRMAFLKGNLIAIGIWPFICLTLGILLWVAVFAKLDEDKRAIEQSVLKEVRTLSIAYAQFLTRTIEQIDQVSLLVKYKWEHSPHLLQLEDLSRQGAFPITQYALVAVIDQSGRLLTANRLREQLPISVADRDYFNFHRHHSSNALRIEKPMYGRLTKRTVIQFTRRLQAADGSFAGVVLVSVQPAYLASFYDGANLGNAGLLAVIGQDGVQRMASIGAISTSLRPDADTADLGALRAVPPLDFKAADTGGNAILRGPHWFADQLPRYTAHAALKSYPLIAMVGVSQKERFDPYIKSAAYYQNVAIVGSVLLFFFCMAAMLLSARLAWRKHQETEVRNAYRLATEGGDDGFYMLRAIRNKGGTIIDFQVIDCNERGAAFYGRTRQEFIGAKSSTLHAPSYCPLLIKTYSDAMASGFYEDELKIPPESPIKVEWVHRRLVAASNGLAVTFRDISKVKAHQIELARLANEDMLTALPNRNWLAQFLPQILERAKRDNTRLALLFVDLDNFKNVNDSLGHSTGDDLLRAAALRLQSVVNAGDHVVRLGGDEFTIILQSVAREAEVAAAASRIVQALHQPFELAQSKHVVGASIGISLFPADGEDAETLLKHSDIAMYQAKAQGKGHYCFYKQNLSDMLNARLDTERALKQALIQDQFMLYYQPRVCTTTGELRALEALVRWKHPQRGLVPPLDFIPLAEETGLIIKLGELVLEQACAQIAQWKKLNLPLVPVSINVSPYQFNHGDIKHLFAACLARHQVETDLVEIEITESSMMGEHAEVSAELSALRTTGIKLLVDDFGTGYSSLSQLQRLDMDVLKVDRAFTSELGKTAEGKVFFHAIVSMAHALGMSVVAEGVETDEQLRMLRSLACDEVQGYFIARPIPAQEAASLMQRRFLLPATDTLA